MKVLFIGLGSIGQRHLANFKRIANEDAEVLVCRETDHNIIINNGMAIPCNSLEQHYGFKQVSDLDKALAEKPDFVFVTNPTSKHLEVALKAAEKGCALFVEKPLAHTMDGIDLLKQWTKKNKLVVMVGYQMRFHPCYKFILKILSEKEYGDVVSAGFEWGTYLPRHHPYEDYRQGYAAQKNLGGGAILGMIHELDIIHSFWGQPEQVYAIGGKLSPLEMNVEDTVSVLMSFKRSKRVFPVTLFLSYAQTKEVRKWRVQLEDATVFCDLQDNSATIFDQGGKIIAEESYSELKRNRLFLNEMNEFLQAVEQKRQPVVSLQDGIESLKLALKIKERISE